MMLHILLAQAGSNPEQPKELVDIIRANMVANPAAWFALLTSVVSLVFSAATFIRGRSIYSIRFLMRLARSSEQGFFYRFVIINEGTKPFTVRDITADMKAIYHVQFDEAITLQPGDSIAKEFPIDIRSKLPRSARVHIHNGMFANARVTESKLTEQLFMITLRQLIKSLVPVTYTVDEIANHTLRVSDETHSWDIPIPRLDETSDALILKIPVAENQWEVAYGLLHHFSSGNDGIFQTTAPTEEHREIRFNEPRLQEMKAAIEAKLKVGTTASK